MREIGLKILFHIDQYLCHVFLCFCFFVILRVLIGIRLRLDHYLLSIPSIFGDVFMHDQHAVYSQLSEADFVSLFSDIYEHSAWVAEQLWRQKAEQPEGYFDHLEKINAQMVTIVEQSSDELKLMLLRAHPDLAGKTALIGALTDASKSEQSGAGLDQCSEEELAYFLQLNDVYRAKFGFPFIMAVKGATKAQILEGFVERTPNDWQAEFGRAMSEVHKIAGFRLASL
ncbi:MAG: 2-oxo-4-hydroxy-4-carboxy-5-ureidoimidazoline decarboxylase [Marinomonas primoryensis]|jgi:OHCU decarboxylase